MLSAEGKLCPRARIRWMAPYKFNIYRNTVGSFPRTSPELSQISNVMCLHSRRPPNVQQTAIHMLNIWQVNNTYAYIFHIWGLAPHYISLLLIYWRHIVRLHLFDKHTMMASCLELHKVKQVMENGCPHLVHRRNYFTTGEFCFETGSLKHIFVPLKPKPLSMVTGQIIRRLNFNKWIICVITHYVPKNKTTFITNIN